MGKRPSARGSSNRSTVVGPYACPARVIGRGLWKGQGRMAGEEVGARVEAGVEALIGRCKGL